jgi:poly-beta-hydroxyalkanoate depolymerase
MWMFKSKNQKQRTSIDYLIDYLKNDPNNMNPSKQFSSDEYTAFLEIAKPYELETDTTSYQTYLQVCKLAGTTPQKPRPPQSRTIY